VRRLAVAGQSALEGVTVGIRHAGQGQPAVEGPGGIGRLDGARCGRASSTAQAPVALDAGGRENMLETQVAGHRQFTGRTGPHGKSCFFYNARVYPKADGDEAVDCFAVEQGPSYRSAKSSRRARASTSADGWCCRA
jgi:hypothetical protein